VKEVERT